MTEVWPYRPQTGLLETIEFMTDPLGSRTGEQRIALRNKPRQIFDFNHILRPAQFSRSRSIMRSNAHLEMYVPVWPDHLNLPGVVVDTTEVIEFDTSYGDWRDRVMVWQDDQTYELKDILSMTASSITLAEPLGTTMVNPVIMPVRTGICKDGFSIRRDTTYVNVSARFTIHNDNVDLSSEYVSTYPQYQSKDVVTERTLMITNINETIIRSADYVDNGFGLITVQDTKNYVDFGQIVAFNDVRPAALWQRRLWLHSLRGKQKTFWLPTFNDDLILAASFGSGATTISVVSIAEPAFYVDRHIMIQLNNGNRYFRRITNALSVGANDTLTISSSLGVAVAPSDIDLFCFISLVRLNSDEIQMDHNFALETTTSIPVMEVPA